MSDKVITNDVFKNALRYTGHSAFTFDLSCDFPA